MPTTKEIKNRIASVQDTKKITNAMYLISSTKLQKAKRELEATRPYFLQLKNEIRRVLASVKKIDSRFFYTEDGFDQKPGETAILSITADKGLAGAYNQNVIKETGRLLELYPGSRLFVVGEYGRHFFEQSGHKIDESFLYTAQNPTMPRAREISSILMEKYLAGEITEIYMVYTDMKNGMETEAVSTRLLPFGREEFMDPVMNGEVAASEPEDGAGSDDRFEFVPGVREILGSVMPSYVTGYIYSALVASFCSEQNARMTAMDSANRNAQKLLTELGVQYNRMRQAAITQEITEVSAGAKAQKKNRKKKAKRRQEDIHE